MSTASEPSNDSGSSSGTTRTTNPSSFDYIITHVFFPVTLPDKNDCTLENESALVRLVCDIAHSYASHLCGTAESQWHHITKMLDNLAASLQPENLAKGHVISQLRGMQTSALYVQPQNAAVIFTKRENCTLFESFEVSPRRDAVSATAGSLKCSYPWSAVEIPNEVFDDEQFQTELADFLCRPNANESSIPSPTPGCPYITTLLTGILRSVGGTANFPRITKRVRDDVGKYDHSTWRRSPIWLLIRVVIQMSFDRSPLGRTSFKKFMLFFTYTLARDESNFNLSSDLLHLISSKIFRRLTKLGSFIPNYLSHMALETCSGLRKVLDTRLEPLINRPSPFRNPSQEELARDTQLSLRNSRKYILDALANHGHQPCVTPFYPCHHPRGTLEEFLSSNGTFFEEAYKADPAVTLYDIEQSIQQGIDDWLARVTDIEGACIQLEILMDKYMVNSREFDPEDNSRMLLTGIELFVALDKLTVKEIPMLADYSSGIPIPLLERMSLRNTTDLHRHSRAYQYLSMRHSQSRPGWSVLSNEFTEDSFPVRYYDQSPSLQQLKARIEADTRFAFKQEDTSHLVWTCEGSQGDEQHSSKKCLVEGESIPQLPLPSLLLHAKVVIFELQCPTIICVWRSAAARISYHACGSAIPYKDLLGEDHLLAHHPVLKSYCMERPHGMLPLSTQIEFAYFYPEGSQPRSNPQLCYTIRYPDVTKENLHISKWHFLSDPRDWTVGFLLRNDCKELEKYVNYTSHTSNDVLAAQTDCPSDLSLDEFITFAHLRSGGLLQWINILHGLRSRTLNLHRQSVHFLISRAALQVGPLDLNTGEWIWHRELQDSSFCHSLLDELASLLVDIGAGSIDDVMMNSISLLLTRILASSPSEYVSERTVVLLQNIRRKTFRWLQELSYDLAKAPTNMERGDILWNMAATCRSTFDVDPIILSKIVNSAEDVDALLSCALYIHALSPRFTLENYPKLLIRRDLHLSLALESTLRNVIDNDPSDYGIDLAIGRICASHKPDAQTWEQLPYPNSRWIKHRMRAPQGQYSQCLYLNLLNGILKVDGKLISGLMDAVKTFGTAPVSQEIFRDQGFFVVPSNLPGMDFMTIPMVSKQRVHFSLRSNKPVIRVQCDQTNDILELIPPEILRNDLPEALIQSYVHWLNVSTKMIEIRPLDRLWEQSFRNWKIDCSFRSPGQYGAPSLRAQDSQTLVCIASQTARMLSKCFGFLDSRSREEYEGRYHDLLITTFPVNDPQSLPILRLSVVIPSYGLSFFVNDWGELESHDFKDMVCDENQYVGALVGLENLLVLRQKANLSEKHMPRRILIPNNRYAHKYGDHRVLFERPLRDSGKRLYYTYDVDTEIGCLIGDGSMASMRHLAHLYTMTSHHRPDPLTGKTGIQTGVCLLGSAVCWSSMGNRLDSDHRYLWSYEKIVGYLGHKQGGFWNQLGGAHNHPVYGTSVRRATQRAGHLIPSGAIIEPTSDDMNYSIEESELELEGVVFTAASAVSCWSSNARTIDAISIWMEFWSKNLPSNTDSLSESESAHDNGPDPRDVVQRLHRCVYDILEKTERTNSHFKLLFLLPTTAYCSASPQVAFLSMFIAFAKQSGIHMGKLPAHVSDGYRPTKRVILNHIHRFLIEERDQPVNWSSELESALVAANHLLGNWSSNTSPTVSLNPRVWDVERITASIRTLFSSCYHNRILKDHLACALAPSSRISPYSSVAPMLMQCISNEPVITLGQLFSCRPTPELLPRNRLQYDSHKSCRALSDMPALNELFTSLPITHAFQRQYIAHLDSGAQRLREESKMIHRVAGTNIIQALEGHYEQCRTIYFRSLHSLKNNLGPTTDSRERTLYQFDHWPPITAESLLRCLASTSPVDLPLSWKKCLTSFALLLLDVQRARRLLRFALDGSEEELSGELENEGCDGWDPEQYPDWLLIQIQGNFLIRRTQAETAAEMISPQSKKSTVFQVNMGEGKSSVIIPIAAAALADGKQLARVIVPKTLSVQTFELLVTRLGWLPNRPIYHLPFSRSPEYNHRGEVISFQIDDLRRCMVGCMTKCGILLVQPEHVASLKLMSMEEQIRNSNFSTVTGLSSGLEQPLHSRIMKSSFIKSLPNIPNHSFVGNIFRLLGSSPNHSGKKTTSEIDRSGGADTNDSAANSTNDWFSLQRWVHANARDILDESDEILHTRFQLIYTIGLQHHMDGYPDRWTITQRVLRLVKGSAQTLSRNHPDSIQWERGPPGSFPHVHIVKDSDGGRRLISLIVEDVMAGRLTDFNFRNISQDQHDAIRSFISDEDVFQVPETVKRVEDYARNADQNHMWSGLLLLRGLLASNVLFFALSERRWRVDYGLVSQPQRPWTRRRIDEKPPPPPTMLAVPYRAKDIPAPRTQFGHPDITIIFTCLSYYYTGLSKEQLRMAFEAMLNEDDPASEYARWVEDYDDRELLPGSLQRLNEINLRSSEQWDNVIFPLFTQNHAAVDFFLSRVVFPEEAKEFPWKISASSWDLAEKREKLITGFSGTNDSRWLLPMSITQGDLDHQQGSNARILAYLLQPENNFYMAVNDSESGERRSTPEFLKMVAAQRPEIRVLLDVGAQILDLSNREVAKVWLNTVSNAAGAIYFNEKDELVIITRTGATQPMLSSPLSQKLDCCVVYLDHAHTRGTDIRFPIGFRAAVTLGPKVTKDNIVQGCMRMRKLGHGHSVMFFAPPEVDQNIRTVSTKKQSNTRVTSADVLCWAIRETWNDIQQRAPYWAQQGMKHKLRCDAWSRFCNNDFSPEQLSEVWLEPDFKLLEDVYSPSKTRDASTSLSQLDPKIRQRCKDLGVLSLPTIQMDEQQEREVNREREREREVELPPKAAPAKHSLHRDVEVFVKTGIIPPLHSGSAFRPVFTTLEKCSAASTTIEADVWSPFILATTDFCNTIEPDSTLRTIDRYLRPVQWVLSSGRDHNQVLVLLSPFEVNHLMPSIRASEHVHLHVYAPRTSKRMKPSDHLDFYTIPPLPSDWAPPLTLIDQLNVFAGQLYLSDYTSYLRLRQFLGIPPNKSSTEIVVRRNLFKIPGSFEETEITFSDSPIPSVMALLAIRNRGRPYAHTDMGKFIHGLPLSEEDFTGNHRRSARVNSNGAPGGPGPDASILQARIEPFGGDSDTPKNAHP